MPGEETKAAASTATAATPSKRKKSKIKVTRGRIYVQSTYNNTIITITDVNGNVIGWGSSGRTGFKGSKKSTPYAAQKTMEEALARLKDVGLSEVDVFVKGIGTGRESAVRALQGSGFSILSIKDQTPIPHAGVRPKKARRV
ncbi:MAG: 30S ribosomal protein S11 [Candidatus Doudnabacteria bacterium RIFCSPLOWO2_02_FULL_42_9]|uniref:Small ribosomal subunit protein uS11 n=1 Tax=Candidatus Doudnabacteria bacterium RIFCSPHIGHO2_01_FULL_41_86 TaxID=1817821 RepID=A0A1F5N8A1_9BACT|nr:MAG: 30S ribosomal protein S11 [Candidatus Doudnabacteria bacterium RIFCSPHIGHO2_01_FULL_41_86]OGE75706.1 MAG: 30S ribosomal protein S11 [Candidatus Doudnabacteria bacterium RIFCSPHIGHO2_01_43_10]OGE85852.1 MAG: 30S ribosomal protein S11 [Candidatus Doudnabacteria bacterium RIFCSPHIGHO2_12_FULL_42_22]OGE87346.1 MAG: 30S ribosomal protein S11 [Candidatus Doudnabacteria bacterium RIFCSPHIGHO2_02_FULL_42_25]OGE92184.1 MAG: 30S ribosomal protein S11 [Candidatus Doudnabacteria bacterium RIFCSPLOW